MAKRIAASILGVLAIIAGLVAFLYAFEGTQDFRNPTVPFKLVVIGELVMFSMSLAALWVGVRLLQYALSGRSGPGNTWVRPVFLGLGCFFPSFVFSFPLAALWASHTWRDKDRGLVAALETSFYIGVGTALICSIAFLKKHIARSNSSITQARAPQRD